ncbi:cardiolipin synthase [Bacillus sp. JZ8]
MIALTIIGLIFLLIVLLIIDFTCGSALHRKTAEEKLYPKRKGDITFYTEGYDLFEQLFSDVRNATKSIHVLFYIIRSDEVGQEFLTLLKEKRQQGVEVCLLLDWVGSSLTKKDIQLLREKGIKFSFTHKPTFPFLFYKLNTRNHRKITVIDNSIGYIGGFNIGKEYLGFNPKLGAWKDFHLRITGEGVADLQNQFCEDWKRETEEVLYPPEPSYNGTFPCSFQFKATDGKTLEQDFITMIEKAKKEIYIGTPYFVPSQKLFQPLLDAIDRGVNVNILTPLKADHPLIPDSAFPYYKPLLKKGGRVFRHYYGFYHSKVIVIDDVMCDIGTANFDKRSLFLNKEINCYMYSPSFILQVKKIVCDDINDAEELMLEDIQKRTWFQKTKEQISKLVSPLL